MSWNDGYERKRFIQRMKEQAEEYRRYGMDEEAIKEMEEYDWELYRDERTHQMHNQSFSDSSLGADTAEEGENALFLKYENQLSVTQDILAEHSRYWWIEELDNPVLVAKIKQLSTDDIEMITQLAFENKTKKEISEFFNCSDVNIIKKFKRIKNFLG